MMCQMVPILLAPPCPAILYNNEPHSNWELKTGGGIGGSWSITLIHSSREKTHFRNLHSLPKTYNMDIKQ